MNLTRIVLIVSFRPNHPTDGPYILLPSPLPLPPQKAHPSTPPPPSSLKRSAPDDVLEIEPSSKRMKTNNGPPPDMISSPSKKRRFEEDGLILLDNLNDQLEDDVIEID
jgi:ubiquitin-like 1-activating enzyme E1 B